MPPEYIAFNGVSLTWLANHARVFLLRSYAYLYTTERLDNQQQLKILFFFFFFWFGFFYSFYNNNNCR